jgi:hypothetical protein
MPIRCRYGKTSVKECAEFEVKPELFHCIITAGIIFAAVMVWVVKSRFEAQAFNTITGKNVTTWQAMWVELRVQEQGGVK